MPRWPRRRAGGARPPAPTPSANPTAPQGASGPPLSTLPGLVATTGSPEERRFAQVYAADRVGPMPYPNQATPDVGTARGRVRTLVGELLEGVDEGTGAALDPLIASWASGWLSRIDSQHADHQAVIDRLVGGARQQLAEAEASHERDRRALAIARRDYEEARERLTEPVGAPAEPAPRHADRSPRDRGRADPDDGGGRGGGPTEALYRPGVPPADPPTGPLPRPVHPTRSPDRGGPVSHDPRETGR
ncbi:hypothetical protein [Actinomycetospora cinnamomea]|uniref:Uncharacterized protein n=1 Tax=Actinomycetospora cinnamomea TaxID=663609 RepID=A0A2U1F781_9PSEU|nr:hypothetical protein [Actinomycetospora cinnamomea]PVZ08012.1 hypothetical protein C8D89_110166 [Actinomycetospora cinnamomea]